MQKWQITVWVSGPDHSVYIFNPGPPRVSRDKRDKRRNGKERFIFGKERFLQLQITNQEISDMRERTLNKSKLAGGVKKEERRRSILRQATRSAARWARRRPWGGICVWFRIFSKTHDTGFNLTSLRLLTLDSQPSWVFINPTNQPLSPFRKHRKDITRSRASSRSPQMSSRIALSSEGHRRRRCRAQKGRPGEKGQLDGWQSGPLQPSPSSLILSP